MGISLSLTLWFAWPLWNEVQKKVERIQWANAHVTTWWGKAKEQQTEWNALSHRHVPTSLSYGEWTDIWQGLQGRYVSEWEMDDKGGWAYWRSNSGAVILNAMKALGQNSVIQDNMRWDTCLFQIENEQLVMACQWRWWQSPH